MALLGRDTFVTGPFQRGVLLLETLVGREVLGRPYAFELGLLSEDPHLDADAVLGQPLVVGIKLASGACRYFHGIVTSFGQQGSTHRHARYSATLEPTLARLERAADCRVFNEAAQTALGIVTGVLAERGVTDVESGAVQGHPFRARELCVQYRETDFHFAQRLLEEEGIYYFFRHEEGKHTMVLANSVAAHAAAAGYETVPYAPKERDVAGAEEHFWGMRVRQGLYPGRHTVLSGYDPTKPRPRQAQYGEARSTQPAPGSQFEHYDYPGGLSVSGEAAGEVERRLQADHAEQTFVEVEGNTVGLGVGALVALRPAFADESVPFWRAEDFGKQFLVVGASYRLSIDQYETGTVVGVDEPFRATYQLLDAQTQFRPPATAWKPRMGGPQTALVVGPAGEEIWTDELGRVRVQFDWDRLGERDEKSTCWVRTAQMWAGPEWGAQHVPRIGHEVLVRFLDGDPDRPIIAGALYDADNMPPYELPAHATQSGIKSRSSKGGAAANFNELRFEDEKGAEELHLQAERDMSTLVKHCQTLRVGMNRDIVVGNDETNRVEANRDLTVRPDDEQVKVKDSVVVKGAHDKTIIGPVLQIYADDHSRKVDGEQELLEEKNKNEHVKQAFTLTTDKKFQLNQGDTSLTFKSKNVTLDSAGEILVTAGGATVSIDQAGLTTLESPAGITLTCGGSSIAVLPGGIAIAAPAFTAAAGGGSKMSLGADAVAITSKKVTIEAEGVCKLRGKKALKLQESEPVKGRKKGAGWGKGEKGQFAAVRAFPIRAVDRTQKGAQKDSATLEIHVVDLAGSPQDGLAFHIKLPDGGAVSGKLDKDGRGRATSTTPGRFTVAFPKLDGADWDGDGAEELALGQERHETGKVTATSEDRVPALARERGFLDWRSVWYFAGNAALRELRENPNVLWNGDKVAIPSKLARIARVTGGVAEYLVHREDERIVTFRLLDFDHEPFAGVRYQSSPGDADMNRGIVPDDGWVTLAIPPGAKMVEISLYPSGNEDEEPIQMGFRVEEEALGDSPTHKQQRLINLGLTPKLSGDDDEDELTALALARYRSVAGDHESEDSQVLDEAMSVHDGDDQDGPA